MTFHRKGKFGSSRLQSVKNESFLCSLAVLIICSLSILYTYGDYGIPWDDTFQAIYGNLTADYFRSGFQDTSVNNLLDTRYYGPLFELMISFAVDADNNPIFEWRRLLIALAGMGTVLGVIQLAKRLNVPLAPTFAALALVMMPRFYGHAFLNSKDIPFACAFTWLQVILCSRFRHPKFSWASVALTGLGLGLVFSTRPGSLPLVMFLTFLTVATMALVADSPLHTWRKAHGGRQLIVKGLVSVLSGWAIMVLFWPWAHQNPIVHPIRSMMASVAFENIIDVLFDGKVYLSNDLPWYYLPKTILITTPLITILLAAFGLFLGAKSQVTAKARPAFITWYVIVIWALVPVLLVVIVHPNLYDGLRHFMFLLPAIALLAGYGAARLVSTIKTAYFRSAAAAVISVLLAIPLGEIIALHPYQYCYYNVAAGGLEGASGRYETDYWLTSYKEAAAWINERGKLLEPDQEKPQLLVAANVLSTGCLRYYLDDAFGVATTFEKDLKGSIPEPFLFYVSTTRFGFDKNYELSPVVKTIGRKGAVFTVIREVR